MHMATTALQVRRADMIGLFEALQFTTADTWNDKRLNAKIADLPELCANKPAIEDNEKMALLKSVLKTIKGGGTVNVTTDEDAEASDETTAPVEDATDAAETVDDGTAVEDTSATDGGDDIPSGDANTATDDTPPKGKKKGKKSGGGGKKSSKPKEPKPKKMTMLEAAEVVLEGNGGEPMKTTDMIMQMDEQDLWSSPNGKTPAATLYVRLLHEERDKGRTSRFKKVGPGLFALSKDVKD